MALTKIPSSLLDTSSGLDLSGNITLGDNEQILLGDSSDLRLYHDGTNSYIDDNGDGNLTFRTVNQFQFEKFNTELLMELNADGAVNLYYDNSKKFETSSAGATVTGTLTVTGDLDITGNINSYNVTDLDVTDQTITLGAGQTEANSGGSGIIVDGSNASILWDETNTSWDFNNPIESSRVNTNAVNNVGNSANIIYRSSTNTIVGNNASALVVQDGGNVGIGTTSPQAPLHARNGSSGVSSYIAGTRAIIEGTATTYLTIAAPNTSLSGILFADPDDSDNGYIKYDHSTGGVMDFGTAGSNRVRIDSSGNVGIGTNSPSYKLEVAGDASFLGQDVLIDSQSGYKELRHTQTGENFAISTPESLYFLIDSNNDQADRSIIFAHNNTVPGSATELMRIAASGNVGIGTSSPASLLHLRSSTPNLIIQSDNGQSASLTFGDASDSTRGGIEYTSTDDLVFKTNNLTEQMRIRYTGNVGIGTASPSKQLEIRNDTATTGSGGASLRLTRGDSSAAPDDPIGIIEFYSTDADGAHVSSFVKGIAQDTYGRQGALTFGTSQSIATDATEAMRIDASGNVGIGISAVQQLQSDSVYPRIQSYSSATSGHFCGLMIGRPNSPGLESSLAFTVGGIMVGKIQHDYVAANHNDMSFHLRGATPGTDIEVMRLWAGSGTDTALLVGRTTRSWSSAKLEVESNARIGNLYFTGSGSNAKISAGNGEINPGSAYWTGGATGLDISFNVVVTGVGITTSAKLDSPTGDWYTNDGTVSSLSDERVKTDIQDLSDGLEIVKQLRPVTFKYNDDSEDENGHKRMGGASDKVRYGFIAQEVEEVAPQYVETGIGYVNNEEVDDFKSMSTTRMIPMLFKAIQELSTELDAAKARITQLENA